MRGGNSDNRADRLRRNREIMDDGRCAWCPPHGGENEGHNGGHRRHGHWTIDRSKHKNSPDRYAGAKFIPSKRKDVK
jgi:hypothetical protein